MSGEVKLDLARAQRIGFGEAVFCADKSVAQIDAVLDAAGGAEMLITRLAPAKFAALKAAHRDVIDYDDVSETGFFQARPGPGVADSVAIVAAGTSDARVAREAARTLEFNGVRPSLIVDVGVAGLWRLTERMEEIAAHPVVIAVAGMDAAMVSVLGGLVPGLLVAVPTSTGYGAARGGETALAASLATCAPGVVVCNIDNGYGAACAALRALKTAHLVHIAN